MNERERMEAELELLRLRSVGEDAEPADLEIAEQHQQPEQSPGVGETFLRHAGQGVTAGLGDEVSAAVELGLGKAMDFVAGRKGEDALYGDASYGELRDENRAILDESAKANPKAAMAGNVAGGVALTAPLGPAASIGKALKVGAGLGAAAGFGESKESDVVGMVGDAAKGAAIGGALGGVGHTIGNIVGSGKAIMEIADEFSARTTGMAGSQIKRIGLERFKKVGELLNSLGITSRLKTLRVVAREINSQTDDTGKMLGHAYKEAKRNVPETAFVPDSLIKHIQNKLAQSSKFADDESIGRVGKELNKLLSKHRLDKNLDVEELWEISKKLDDMVGRYGRSTIPKDETLAKGLYDATDEIRKLTIDQIDAVKPEMADSVKLLADKYKSLVNAKQAVLGFRARTAGKIPVSPYDIVGAPSLRNTYQALVLNPAKVISKMPEKFASALEEASKRGGHALAATHYALSQSDESYRKAAANIFPEEAEE